MASTRPEAGERHGAECPSEPPAGPPCPHSAPNFWPPGLWDAAFLCKAPSLRCPVTAAWANHALATQERSVMWRSKVKGGQVITWPLFYLRKDADDQTPFRRCLQGRDDIWCSQGSRQCGTAMRSLSCFSGTSSERKDFSPPLNLNILLC